MKCALRISFFIIHTKQASAAGASGTPSGQTRYRSGDFQLLRRRNAINPPRKTDEKQKSAAHVGPAVLSKKPKIQLHKAVLLPTVKSRIPATEPGNLPTRSLPMVRHVAKSGERPIPVRAIARVAMKAF